MLKTGTTLTITAGLAIFVGLPLLAEHCMYDEIDRVLDRMEKTTGIPTSPPGGEPVTHDFVPVINGTTGKPLPIDFVTGLPDARSLRDMLKTGGLYADSNVELLNGGHPAKAELYRYYPEYSVIRTARAGQTTERVGRHTLYAPSVVEELIAFATIDDYWLKDRQRVYGSLTYELGGGRKVVPYVERVEGVPFIGIEDDPDGHEWPPGTRFLFVDGEREVPTGPDPAVSNEWKLTLDSAALAAERTRQITALEEYLRQKGIPLPSP